MTYTGILIVALLSFAFDRLFATLLWCTYHSDGTDWYHRFSINLARSKDAVMFRLLYWLIPASYLFVGLLDISKAVYEKYKQFRQLPDK